MARGVNDPAANQRQFEEVKSKQQVGAPGTIGGAASSFFSKVGGGLGGFANFGGFGGAAEK